MPNRRKGHNSKSSVAHGSKQKGASNKLERVMCICQASKHPLINNCLNCGRIICEVEGSGPCMTCGEVVCTKQEELILLSEKGTAARQLLEEKLYGEPSLSFQDIGNVIRCQSDFEKAVLHKNKLLEYDMTLEKRTKVIDDEGDYFSTGDTKWMTKAQRNKLELLEQESHEARHDHRKSHTFTIDLSNKQVFKEEEKTQSLSSRIIDEILKDDISVFDHIPPDDHRVLENYRPKFMENKKNKIQRKPCFESKRSKSRIQDQELQCMSDEGKCLGVYQPYASLIVLGFKKHEGQSLSMPCRGKIWIYALKRRPTFQEISEATNLYSGAPGDLPTYHLGKVVGCVTLVDCLSQEEYRKKFPDGKCGTSYVLIFENPKALKIQIPIEGKQGLFSMSSQHHGACKKILFELGS